MSMHSRRADLEELQIKKSSESPNDRVRFRFDLQIRLILELQPNIHEFEL